MSTTSGTGIRPATDQDLEWLHNGPDPKELEQLRRDEVERVLNSSPTPAHWKSAAEDIECK